MESMATTNSDVLEDKILKSAITDDALNVDSRLLKLKRQEILELSCFERLRWMYLMRVQHKELNRLMSDLQELLKPDIDVNIISVIGMTGAGKTTLANGLRTNLKEAVFGMVPKCEQPVLLVKAPANGDKSFSWKSLYHRILAEAEEPLPYAKRGVLMDAGYMAISLNARKGLDPLRLAIESMLKNRNVRVLVIDEVLHLLRFGNYSAVMDTLKSLADSYSTKLILVGAYNLAELMQDYGQVAKRSEILHYRRYHFGVDEDKEEFFRVLEVMQNLWPCREVPDLSIVGELLMKANLGCIGLLKGSLMRLASLQMAAKNEKFSSAFLKKAVKSKKLLSVIEAEVLAGEAELVGATYGESVFADQAQQALLNALEASVRSEA